MAAITALLELRHELGGAFGQHNVAPENDGITRKVHRLFRCNIDQVGHVLADCALAVLVEGHWKPKRPAVGQRAKAGVKMIKPRIHKFHGDNETTKHVCDGAM